SCRFATREPDGLLLYNGRFNQKHDFIALEIVNEQIQLTFSAGETKTTVSPFIAGGVSDGRWHTAHVHYYNKVSGSDGATAAGRRSQTPRGVSRCSAKRHFCSTNPCLNGGSCVNLWGLFRCDCPLGFGGRNCEKVMPNPLRFHGNGLLSWRDLVAMVTVPWHLEFMFRTRQPTATLIQISSAQQHNLTIQLREGYVLTSVQRGEDSTVSRVDDVTVSDGQWHHLLLELRGGAGSITATLSLDHGLYTSSMDLDSKLKGVKLKTVSVGGITDSRNKVISGFRGCVQGLRLGDSASAPVFPSMHQADVVNVESGCSLPNPCGSNPCPAHSDCSDDWDTHSCRCHSGYYGNNCSDACTLNPCEHQSACSRKSSSAHGYTCNCPSSYFGQYCEKKTDLPCPRGWWGDKSCGPCNCDTAKGFDADCNKTSGACRCKDNHFRPAASAVCLLCDCYAVGSFSRACDRDSGQCPCKPGVIGRQCDRCDNPFAEVSSSGCEVIYDSCPQAIEAGIWWPRTKFGLPAAVSCPRGSLGTAIRHCDEHKGWLSPNLFNCTSVSFSELKTLSERLARNASLMDSGNVQQTATLMSNATKNTRQFYGSDVKIAYHLTSAILQHESRQQGFNLTATQDVLFNEHLMHVGSAILSVETRGHWELIQQTEGGTATLLRQFEEYTNTLAQNMRKTYLSPFTIVTPNIVISIDRLEKMNFAGAKLPRYESLRGPRPLDLETAVTLPDSVFIPAPEGKGQRHQGEPITEFGRNQTANWKKRHPDEREQDAIASVIIFHSLAALLPERYDTDKRSLSVPSYTPVGQLTVHDNEELLQHTLDKPITVQFRLVTTEERSKPICVFWNPPVAGGPGGWSSKGCEVVFRNSTHISCQCYHMTSFAVLMDISRRENGEILPVKLITWSSVGVTLGFLFLTIVFLTCLRAASSNKTSIVINGSAALFTAHLVFILGINQADNPFLCTVMAILLHFLWLCVFSWLFLEGLHVYRMLSELRDINYGPMRFYYLIGWGVPAFITGLAVGLDPEGYGNPDFCWLSLYDTLVWSLAGPVAFVLSMNVFLYIMASRASCSLQQKSCEKRDVPAAGLRTACAVLLLVTVTCLLALLSVNSDLILFHYLFAGFCCAQGPFIFFFRVVFNKEARDAMHYCCGKKRADHMIRSKPSAFLCNSHFVDGRLYHLPFTESSGVLNGTRAAKSSELHALQPRGDDLDSSHLSLSEHNTLFKDKEQMDDHDSDSDSDLSELEDDQSGSYASTHSSDSEEDEGEFPQEECWENLATSGPIKPHGILKKKQLSPIAERNAINHIHNQLSGDSASSRGPSSSEGRGGGARRDHQNGASTSGMKKMLDNDSSESE
ncbi:hypothetical protein cypCar_00028987, partial [Cyprinus carpio]